MKYITRVLMGFIIFTGFIFTYSIVSASYDKPTPPAGLSSGMINSVNTILDAVYNKKNNKTKFPTDESYVAYLDKVNLALNNLKNNFSSTDTKYIIVTYLYDGLTNIKSSVQNDTSFVDGLGNIVNDDTGTSSTGNTGSSKSTTGTITDIKGLTNDIVKSGCSTINKYFARPSNIDRTAGIRYSPDYFAIILEVCSQDSSLDTVDSTKTTFLHGFSDIKNSCPSGFHVMEKWELDGLGGLNKYEFKEPLGYERNTLVANKNRFDFVNKDSATHWLYDNYYDSDSNYVYSQGSKDKFSVPDKGVLKIRCVKNNNLSRNNIEKKELSGCSNIISDGNSGLEYCSLPSKLQSDYTTVSYNNIQSETEMSKGKIKPYFLGDPICQNGYDFPDYFEYYKNNPALRKGAIYLLSNTGSYYDTKGNLKFMAIDYYLFKLKKGYALTYLKKGSNILTDKELGPYMLLDNIDNISENYKITQGVSYNSRFSSSFSSAYDLYSNSIFNHAINYLKKNRNGDENGNSSNTLELSGICIKQTQSVNDYNLKLSGCSKIKTVGSVNFCTEISELGTCLGGYHEFKNSELKANKSQLFIEKTYKSAPILNFPFKGDQYGALTNLGQFQMGYPTYYLDGLNYSDYDSYRNGKEKYITITHYTNYTKGEPNYRYYHFSGIKENGVSVICVKD